MTVADLIEPLGELSDSMFTDVDEYVAAWLTEAEGKTSNEAAQRAWVYHRAYTSLANRMHAGLASEKKGDASAARSDAQFAYWAGRASSALATFNGLTAGAGPILTRVRL